MFCYKRLSILIVLPLFLLLALAGQHALAAEERLLVFGRVYHDPVRTIRDRQEFVDYIAKKLAPVGITGGRIVVVDKMHLLARAVTEDKVDFFHDSVVPTMVLSSWSGSIPILRQWKYGEAEYYGVILVKKDSGIDTLSGLRGKVIAFDEPHSTSAHILPRMLLAENKIKLVQMTSSAAAQPDKVGYLYGSDGSSPNLLITGRVDAAATSYREFEELRPQVRETLKVIGRTKSVARQIISVRKNLNSNIAKALRQVLLNMHKDPEGREALKKQQRTTKIDEISPKSLEELKSMQSFVFSTLGKEVDLW